MVSLLAKPLDALCSSRRIALVADLVALGELLMDLVADTRGVSIADAERFIVAPGGAPANVAVGAARLGTSTAFLGQVGDDPFGHKLAAVLLAEGVDVTGLVFDPGARTALAFVSLGTDGERQFTFYRHPSADMLYRPEQVDEGLIRSARVLHFGSISLIDEPVRSATLKAAAAARDAGVLLSFDPNLRLSLWPGESEAREGMRVGCAMSQVIKVSEEELEFLTGGSDIEAARRLMHPGLELLMVTRGPKGADYLTHSHQGSVRGFAVEATDTTGAGDAFMAAILSAIVQNTELTRRTDDLEAALTRANACAALTVTRHGAIPALPAAAELELFLAHSSA